MLIIIIELVFAVSIARTVAILHGTHVPEVNVYADIYKQRDCFSPLILYTKWLLFRQPDAILQDYCSRTSVLHSSQCSDWPLVLGAHSRLCHVPNIRVWSGIDFGIKHSCYTDLNKLKLPEPGALLLGPMVRILCYSAGGLEFEPYSRRVFPTI